MSESESAFISEDARLAVKRGAMWMDENHPGWEHLLDLSQLQMNQCSTCVIGQAVQGSFYEVIEEAAGSEYFDGGIVWAAEHGFDTLNESGGATKEYIQLERAWTEEVKSRREFL